MKWKTKQDVAPDCTYRQSARLLSAVPARQDSLAVHVSATVSTPPPRTGGEADRFQPINQRSREFRAKARQPKCSVLVQDDVAGFAPRRPRVHLVAKETSMDQL